jgi:hypothetical protein
MFHRRVQADFGNHNPIHPPSGLHRSHKMAGCFPYSSLVYSSMASILANRWINLYAIKVYSRSELVRIQNFIGVFWAFRLLPAVFSPFGLVAAEYAPKSAFEEKRGIYTATQMTDGAVTCQEQLVATYTNEPQNFELSGRNYTFMSKSGDWLACGYSKQ